MADEPGSGDPVGGSPDPCAGFLSVLSFVPLPRVACRLRLEAKTPSFHPRPRSLRSLRARCNHQWSISEDTKRCATRHRVSLTR